MKSVRAIVLASLVFAVAAPAEETGFWRQLTPEERRAAGVDQLTPEQQSALDQLAGRFAREGARQATEQTRQEIREQAKKEVREEVRAEVKQEVRAEVKQELKAEETTKAVARAGRPAEENTLAIHSRIIGKFNGWSGATVFHLENGQTWVQTDSGDRYWLPTVENPDVELRPSKIGGWKLYVGGKGAWVRVRRL